MFHAEAFNTVRKVAIEALASVVATEDGDYKSKAAAEYYAVWHAVFALTRGRGYAVRRAASALLRRLPDGAACPRAWEAYRAAHFR